MTWHADRPPDHPGMAMSDAIEEAGLTQAAVARMTGLSAKHVNLLASGQARLTADVAVRLGTVVDGLSARALVHQQADCDLDEAIRSFFTPE